MVLCNSAGADTGFRKGGGGGGGVRLTSTKTRSIRVHTTFFPLLEVLGFPEGGGGVLTPRAPPPGSAPEIHSWLIRCIGR